MFIAAAAAFCVAQIGVSVAFGSPRAFIVGLMFAALSAWLAIVPRRALAVRPVASVVAPTAVVVTVVLIAAAPLQPHVAITAATALLIPTTLALPHLEGEWLRRLMVLAWAGIVLTGVAAFLPNDHAVPPVAAGLLRLWGLGLASGIVLFLLHRLSERLKASRHEFRQLFRLSSDLAEATEPGVLGELVARHLAEAIGFDDCVIYALAPETGQLAPFGSYPVERALQTGGQSLAARPVLGRVIRDRAPIVIDVIDYPGEFAERVRLRTVGREVMLLLPLVATAEPVGVAELTASKGQPVDERRLALARTLAFEGALAIENGRLYRELRHRALHDPLTGLANRGLFHDRVEHALARLARREGAIVAILFVDIDNFKTVNDRLGHARGDRLLTLVGERLREVVRPADTVARLGGDEYALLLEELDSGDEALAIAERAVGAVAAPFHLNGQPINASISIGVALRTAHGATVDDLVQEADAAMYEAKRTGKGRAVRFSPGLHRPAGSAGAPEPIGTQDLESAAQARDGSVAH
ncbi:MAG TPA: sensor domain-containing diguanylate cyclase [Candidatus Sulfomarinibacteraceae bacterium]|nr:sensor domain-containing diguanylate cyclase [Candidatus Sulfomarinibacteraceae bacterium]